MLAIPYFKQDTGYSCGPVAVQMVLAYFRQRDSENHLIKEVHAHPDAGTENRWIPETLRSHGIMVSEREQASLENIRVSLAAGEPVIVNYINPETGHGHYAVVIDCNDERLLLNDPRNGPGYEIACDEFLPRWRSGDGTHVRWMCSAASTQ